MQRIVDKPYFTYSCLSSELNVKCSKCHGFAIVTADEDAAFFRCTSCGHVAEKDRTIYRCDVHNQCKCCGRYYRVDIHDTNKQHFQVLHVSCPYCGTIMPGKVHKTTQAFHYIGETKMDMNLSLGWNFGFSQLFKTNLFGR